LKLKGLADLVVLRAPKKNPPKNSRDEAGMSMKTKGAENVIFRLSTMLMKSKGVIECKRRMTSG